MVKHFHNGAGQPVGEEPTILSRSQVDRRILWIKNELEELSEAKTIEEQADAVTDCLYYLLGCYVEMGIKPDSLFEIVHKANMKKLENRMIDDDGKVLKPRGWMHPDAEIKEAIEKEEQK